MKLLILFSAWAAGEKDEERAWLEFYKDVINDEFQQDTKIIAINCGSSALVREVYANALNSSVVDAPDSLRIDSDASGYQACLAEALGILSEYDAVLFMHTKGVSYSFPTLAGLRSLFKQTILNRRRLEECFSQDGRHLVCERGHLPQTPPSCFEIERAANMLGISAEKFTFAATYSIYAVSAESLRRVLRVNGKLLCETNLGQLGFNRFFFEGAFPSLLAHEADKLEFLGGCEFAPNWNRSTSADHLPRHNSAMVRGEFQRYASDRQGFAAKCVPYIFGSPKDLEGLRISFDIL